MIAEQCSGEWSPRLSDAEQESLFEILLSSLAWCVEDGEAAYDFSSYSITERLERPRATFVTLNLSGRLRGCIGSLAPEAPLYRSVHQNAVHAALRDPRFPPVSLLELPQLEVHLSILSTITPIASLDGFRLGEHGIILTKGSAGAVFLPEVAVEQSWSVEQTLTQLSLKAGLSADGWREGASFEIFSSARFAPRSAE
jgi:AmmeMemoRadiSam system protein A